MIAWLKAKGINAELRTRVKTSEIAHRHVVGILPLWLAAYADCISEIAMPRLSRMDRTRFNAGELSVAEMDEAGAFLATYRVRKEISPFSTP